MLCCEARLPLRRLTEEVIQLHGVPFGQAVATLKQFLPPHATLVGQNIGKDIEWLGLKEGTDFQVTSRQASSSHHMALYTHLLSCLKYLP